MAAETKLDQLIHANLFKSFWVAGQTDMGEQDVPSAWEAPQGHTGCQVPCSHFAAVEREVEGPALTAGAEAK